MRISRDLSLLLIVTLLVCGTVPAGAAQKQRLERGYKDWVERDAAYIITKEERDSFLRLKSDDERDKFIEQFWEFRNPTPGSSTNSYRDEIYKRIAYASAHFGAGSNLEGWRTDRGRTYITLGPPQQKETYYNNANLFPIEIWFYSFNHPALPPFFYVMFYQHEGIGDLRYYSPFIDGPDKLVTGTEAINNRRASLKMIQDSVGPLVARLTQSLIPGEPVDPNADRPSLQSDTMLATIKGLANNPFTKQELDLRRSMTASIKARLLLPGDNLDITTLPLRDSRGLTRLDYAARFRRPEDFTVEASSDGHYSYSLEALVRVFDSDKKLIFTQVRTMSDSLDKLRFAEIKDKCVGFEGSLPLPPGKYHLDFLLTNWKSKAALRAEKDVVVPATDPSGFTIPGVLPFYSAEAADPSTEDIAPFTLAGMKFVPLNTSPLVLVQDQPIQVAYQIWAAPNDPERYAGQKMSVEYAVGRPALAGGATVTSEEISKDQFDPTGSMVNGKKLPMEGRPPGSYLLTVSLKQPGMTQHAFSTLPFAVLGDAATPGVWDLIDPGLQKDALTGVPDRERGLCLLAQGKADEARQWFRRALDRNHADEVARARLVEAYYAQKGYAAILSLYKDAGTTDKTDAETILRISDSFERSGKPREAITLLEDALTSRPDNGPLYLALAGYYEEIGNSSMAVELTRKGKSLLSSSGSPTPN